MTCLELPGYDVHYSSHSMVLSIAAQLPKILWSVWKEHLVLRKIVEQHGIDAVISDNRYGCFSSKIPCVFVTHQLHIPVPKWLKWCINFCNHLIINRFDVCWVPDVANEPSLSGVLSHPVPHLLRNKTRFIGALTRMQPAFAVQPKYDAIVVLSGPEPQRTELEKLIIGQSAQLPLNLLLVQGKPEEAAAAVNFYPKNVQIVPSMTAEALNQAILDSEIFIGRSGYSTVMDLARLGRPALLIPTPGQSEQEYLAQKLASQNAVVAQQQHELDLAAGIAAAKERKGLRDVFFDEKGLTTAVAELLQSIRA